MLKWLLLVALVLSALSLSGGRRGGGRGGRGRGKKCDDGTKPTCADGSAPVFDGDRSTPPCEDGSGKPMTRADGSTPGRGDGRGRGGCRKTSKICCDGSEPVFDGDRSTPPCSDGSRPVCSQAQCSASEGTNPEIDVVVVGEQF